MLKKYAARSGSQWDCFWSGVCGHTGILHTRSQARSLFLLFGRDCHAPIEAAFLSPVAIEVTTVEDFREEFILSLSYARELATKSMKQAQKSNGMTTIKSLIHPPLLHW